MLTKVSKEFIWEMSHRLPFHKGACKNIHGHSYKLRIDLIGEPDADGILVDFYDIDRIISPIVGEFDHAFLVDKDDEVILNFLRENSFKHKVLPYHSTSENIIKYIAELAIPEFKVFANIRSMAVRLYETADAFAEITFDI